MLLVVNFAAVFNQYCVMTANIRYTERGDQLKVKYGRKFLLDITNNVTYLSNSPWIQYGPYIDLVVTILLIYFLTKFYKYQENFAEIVDKKGITASDYTIMIQNVHKSDTEDDIKEFFRAMIGNRRDLWDLKVDATGAV